MTYTKQCKNCPRMTHKNQDLCEKCVLATARDTRDFSGRLDDELIFLSQDGYGGSWIEEKKKAIDLIMSHMRSNAYCLGRITTKRRIAKELEEIVKESITMDVPTHQRLRNIISELEAYT